MYSLIWCTWSLFITSSHNGETAAWHSIISGRQFAILVGREDESISEEICKEVTNQLIFCYHRLYSAFAIALGSLGSSPLFSSSSGWPALCLSIIKLPFWNFSSFKFLDSHMLWFFYNTIFQDTQFKKSYCFSVSLSYYLCQNKCQSKYQVLLLHSSHV